MKNTTKIAVAFLILILIGAIYAHYKYWNIAIVNGKGISRIDYIKTMERVGGKQTLEQMIQDTLILEEGRKNNITMDKKEMDAEIAKVEERIKAKGQTLEAALAESGMNRADLEEQILIQRIKTKLAVSKTEVTQAQIDNFIKTYKAQLPPKAAKAELEEIAKQELTRQASESALSSWLGELGKNAKVIYKQ